MLDVFVLRVEVIQNHIRVATVTGSEDDDLEVFAEILKDFLGVGTDVDSSLDDFSSWESDGQFDIERRSKSVIAVNEGLIQIKDHSLPAYVSQLLPS